MCFLAHLALGRGGGRATANFGALCPAAGTTVLGIPADTQSNLWGYELVTQNHSVGVRRIHKKNSWAARLILTCNTRAPVPPCRRKMLAADPGSKKWPGLRKNFRGENVGGILKNESSRRNFPQPKAPPPPPAGGLV